MLSVIIETRGEAEGLARTLASLVPAAVEGAVREVIVRDPGGHEATRRIAEHAGCVLSAGGSLRAALGRARSDWLLFLPPGARLGEGWIEAVRDHLEEGGGAARFTAARGQRPLLSVLLRRRPFEGLLIEKARAMALEGEDVAGLARRVATRRLRREIFLPL